MPRAIDVRYRDPLDLIWLRCAARLGMTVARSGEVFASWDGRGTLTLSDDAGFDPDDSLAQMVFHELCHALIEGPAGLRRADWGLENIDDRHLVREHACHRLQASLAGRYGLRAFFAVTTDHRPYYDALPTDPLAPCDDPALPLALDAWPAAVRGDWSRPLHDALRATAALAAAVAPSAAPDSLWSQVKPLHPLGFPMGEPDRRCGDCAWRFDAGPGRRVPRCRQAKPPTGLAPRLDPSGPACERWEPALTADACADCGACCREAFHQVEVRRGDAVRKAHPELVARDEYGEHLPRPGGRCVGLRPGAPYLCAIYEDRPRSCREFALAGDNCLEARRRVGLSRRPPPIAG